MPPRTGPRRKKRQKATPPTAARHFAIIRNHDGDDDIVVAHRVELDDGHLIFRDHADAITHILAEGEWRDVHPATIGDMPVPLTTAGLPPDEPANEFPDADESREQATLVGEADLVLQEARVPSSAEEAQRILMEQTRRQPDTDHAPTTPPLPGIPRPKE
jgi:hypothetical protein